MTLEFSNLEELIRYLAAKAREHALKVYDIVLDGSAESVEEIERILGRLHDHYLATQSIEGICGMAMFYGAYIGEIARNDKITGAKWEGEPSGRSFPSLIWQAQNGVESTVFPMSWCYARILEGPTENVWFKYEALTVPDSIVIDVLQHRKTSNRFKN